MNEKRFGVKLVALTVCNESLPRSFLATKKNFTCIFTPQKQVSAIYLKRTYQKKMEKAEIILHMLLAANAKNKPTIIVYPKELTVENFNNIAAGSCENIFALSYDATWILNYNACMSLFLCRVCTKVTFMS